MKQLLPDGYRTYNCQEIFDLHSDLEGKSKIEENVQEEAHVTVNKSTA